jgi:hypothetical protein
LIEPNATTSYANEVYLGSDNASGNIRVTLDSGIPTKVNFKFKEVSKNTASLSALSISYAQIENNGNTSKSNTAVVRSVLVK